MHLSISSDANLCVVLLLCRMSKCTEFRNQQIDSGMFCLSCSHFATKNIQENSLFQPLLKRAQSCSKKGKFCSQPMLNLDNLNSILFAFQFPLFACKGGFTCTRRLWTMVLFTSVYFLWANKNQQNVNPFWPKNRRWRHVWAHILCLWNAPVWKGLSLEEVVWWKIGQLNKSDTGPTAVKCNAH